MDKSQSWLSRNSQSGGILSSHKIWASISRGPFQAASGGLNSLVGSTSSLESGPSLFSLWEHQPPLASLLRLLLFPSPTQHSQRPAAHPKDQCPYLHQDICISSFSKCLHHLLPGPPFNTLLFWSMCIHLFCMFQPCFPDVVYTFWLPTEKPHT